MAAKPRKWVILIPILAGVAALVFLKQNKTEPPRATAREQPRLVRVIRAFTTTVVPQARGHGTVRPGKTWEAVAQVKGKILEKHPNLKKGAILEAGSLLLRIDPMDYRLAIAETEADIEATKAQLDELSAREANTRLALGIEEQALALTRKELERKRRLVKDGSISRSDLDSQERLLLTQQQAVQAQRSALNLIPSQRALLRAQLARQGARLSVARRDLANTEIRLPFAGRVAEVSVEQDQYVREGESLTRVDGLELAEVEVPIPIEQIRTVLHADGPVDILNTPPQALHRRLGLSARVELHEGGIRAGWPGRFARMSDTLDPKTRTVGVIVEVDKPYAGVRPGVRPPLLKGLFVEVVLSGKPLGDRLVLPRSALHDGRIYIAGADGRLEIRPVELELLQPDFAVIGAGLEPGELVVVSDLIPAIEGMLLETREDGGVLERLQRQARGAAAAP
ncbi:MAG TPA: HlyD family efflux transporter periplasmic adaptor subunit [Sedimenticola sp.]|nr:HlyD family efflux transporter periplasmic adaptor subunit [Sedimenticola sp.]